MTRNSQAKESDSDNALKNKRQGTVIAHMSDFRVSCLLFFNREKYCRKGGEKMELKTPLYDAHVKAGGKIVPFGGYLLPVQYGTGVIKEHMAVRTQAGLFDVSHMGEVLCEGKDALANLQMLLTNNFDNMVDGQARYSPMCNEK